MKRTWQVAAVLVAFLIGSVLASKERELVVVELDAADTPYEEPESLAERVRYSEPFAAEGGVRVEVRADDADVHVSLVDSEERVREARVWVDEKETLSFGRVPSERYRLRVTAHSSRAGPVRVRTFTGGFSPMLLAIALFLLLVVPLSWTLRRNLR